MKISNCENLSDSKLIWVLLLNLSIKYIHSTNTEHLLCARPMSRCWLHSDDQYGEALEQAMRSLYVRSNAGRDALETDLPPHIRNTNW